jgi:hypothetical protein
MKRRWQWPMICRQNLETRGIVPHMARRSELGWGERAIPNPPGYEPSQGHRKRIEEIIGWVKTVAGQG